MNIHEHYIIDGGNEGKNRLNVLADAMHEYSLALLQKTGLQEGQSFLDNGCGGGHVAMMAARIVGKYGKVVGLDFDETIIELAKADQDKEALSNIDFKVCNAYDLNEYSVFDMAYARFLLSHLEHPLTALQKMKQAVKPGGTVIIEDIQFSGHFSYPVNPAFNEYVELYQQAVQIRGGNAEIGPLLIALFKQASFKAIEFDMVQPAFTEGGGKWMAYLTLDKIKHTFIKQQLISREALNILLKELKEFTEDPNSIISMPRIFRVWGIK